MTIESCCECNGTGKNRIEMAFGYVDADCTFCDGKGTIRKQDLYRSLTELVGKSFKPLVEQQIFSKSPLMEALERNVAAAQQSMADALAKGVFGSQEGSGESAVRP